MSNSCELSIGIWELQGTACGTQGALYLTIIAVGVLAVLALKLLLEHLRSDRK